MITMQDYMKLHFIVLIWGFTAILGLLISLPSVELVFYRTLIATLLLGFILYSKRLAFQVERRALLKILGTGVIIGLHWILFFASAKIATASVCLAGMTTGSLWTSFLEPLFYKRRIKSYEIFLGLIIIFGLYIIFQFEFNHVLGLSLSIISALMAALFSVINGQLVREHNHFVITYYEMMGACLSITLFFPFYALFFTEGQGLALSLSLNDVFYLFILSGICTVYAYSQSVKLMHKFSPYAINLTVNLEPVYGILLAFLFFGEKEKMTGGFYLGTLIILAAVIIYPYLKKYYEKPKTVMKSA